MRRILSGLIVAWAAVMLAGCGSSEKKNAGKSRNDSIASIVVSEDIEYTELTKISLPCSKELLSAAWKQIGSVDEKRKKILNYRQYPPIFFISTDLDGDGNCEILMRGQQPYAAIFAYLGDSLHLITYADTADMGLGITPDGAIVRSSTERGGTATMQFIRLKDSKVNASGLTRETFVIKNGAMSSEGVTYMLQADTAMVEVSRDEYQQVAPRQEGTFLEDIDGWEDFRKP